MKAFQQIMLLEKKPCLVSPILCYKGIEGIKASFELRVDVRARSIRMSAVIPWSASYKAKRRSDIGI